MFYIGIDVGSVSTDLVIVNKELQITNELYLKTMGDPIKAIQRGLKQLSEIYDDDVIKGVGVTGSGRILASAVVGGDIVKNEITAHAVAAAVIDPDIQTILEIGGQDSKIILLRDGVISDFAMNTVCAAGTGSFLDRQAERLGYKVEELGGLAMQSKNPTEIAGRCAVFAESDIIHKQQAGSKVEDIIAGMSRSLVRNYLSNVAKGKKILSKICFQGGVAANQGIKVAFEEALEEKIFVPECHKVMGAFGSAILAKEKMEQTKDETRFRGFQTSRLDIKTCQFTCKDCENYCQVTELKSGEYPLGYLSDRCGKYQKN